MKRNRNSWTIPGMLLLIAAFCVSSAVRAQEPRLFSLSVLGGLGSAIDAAHVDANNPSLQVGFNMDIDSERLLGVRVGTVSFSSSDVLNGHRSASLTYANISGEYRFREPLYDSGLYLGLGVYEFAGATRAGVVLGYTGEFEVNDRWSVVLEPAGHYANFRHDQAFAQALGGVRWHF